MADQIDEIKNKVDIVEVIGEYVSLKKAGRNFKGLCPFHSEKTPSFMVSPELSIFKCFGCGEAGDVISFLEKYEGMDFYEALKVLADRVGVKLKPLSGAHRGEKEEVQEINELAARFYHFLFLKHQLGEEGREYIFNQRGVEPETARVFKIGVSPSESVLSRFLSKKGFSSELMMKSGLVIKGGSGLVDRFRERIIFPIEDPRGRIIALAGRILPKYARENVGKYINSPETATYHKSDSLYGLSVTKGDIKRVHEAIVVEGEIDLISSWQAGIRNIVAIKGTSLTEGQMRILSRFTSNVTFAMDSDFAGDSAAMRGISEAQERGLSLKVARMGKYKDPDEFARSDPEGLLERLTRAQGVWDFLIGVSFRRHEGKTGTGKGEISRELTPILASISDKIVQSHYIRVVAEKLGVPVESVTEQVTSYRDKRKENTPKVYAFEKRAEKSSREILEEQLMSLMFKDDPLSLVKKYEKDFKTPFGKRIFEELKKYQGGKKFDASAFSKNLPDELKQGFADIFMKDIQVKAPFEKEMREISKRIQLTELNEEMERSARKMSLLEKGGKKKELTRAKREFSRLTKERAQLET